MAGSSTGVSWGHRLRRRPRMRVGWGPGIRRPPPHRRPEPDNRGEGLTATNHRVCLSGRQAMGIFPVVHTYCIHIYHATNPASPTGTMAALDEPPTPGALDPFLLGEGGRRNDLPQPPARPPLLGRLLPVPGQSHFNSRRISHRRPGRPTTARILVCPRIQYHGI